MILDRTDTTTAMMEFAQSRTTPDAARTVPRVVVAVCITMLAALPGLLVPGAVQGWYSTLVHPSFAPPDGWFAPVWSVLYLITGISSGLVWSRPDRDGVKGALMLYGAQLLLNASWTVAFFGLHAPFPALGVIVVLIVLIVLTIRSFFPIHRTAAWLLVPYLLWVLFATVLNAAYVILN